MYEQLCSHENLLLAFKKAKKGKTKKDYIIKFKRNLENNLITLRQELISQTYKPKPLKTFIVRDPKTRKISKSKFRDRIIHHALINIIGENSLKDLISKILTKLKGDRARAKIIEKQIEYTEDWKEKKETSLDLLNHLIEKSFIDKEDIIKPLGTSQIFALYCFPTTPIISKNGKIKYSLNRRIYPNFLKKLGFIRLHLRRGLFYVIPRERLIPSLQNTFYLKQYILEEIEKTFPVEWERFLKELKRKKSLLNEYNSYKNKSYKQELKFNILLLNTDISENNVGYLYGERTFTNDFHNFLNNQLDLKKLNFPRSVKANISEYMKNISIVFFFKGENTTNIQKINDVEPKLKSGLSIIKWTDYLDKNQEEIASIFKLGNLSESRAKKYSELLIKKIEVYRNALRELRINL